MKYTVDEINAKQVVLPGIKLGYKIFDTCSQSAALVKATMFLLSDKATGELAVKCNYTDYEPRVVAIIGPQTSEMVTVIGNLLGFFLMPQVWDKLRPSSSPSNQSISHFILSNDILSCDITIKISLFIYSTYF